MARIHPGIGSVLKQSDDTNLQVLGYAVEQGDVRYDGLAGNGCLGEETPVDDALTRLERRGYLQRNGDGSYHLGGERFNGMPARLEALAGVHEEDRDRRPVYDTVTSILDASPRPRSAGVPAGWLDGAFPDRRWRRDLSPFVMAGAITRANYYDEEQLPRIEPGAAEDIVSGSERPVRCYELGEPLLRKAADGVVAAAVDEAASPPADPA